MSETDTRTDTAATGLNAGQATAAGVAILLFAALAWGARFYFAAATPEANVAEVAIVETPPAAVAPIDRAALRRKAWDQIQPRLDAADAASRAAVDEQLAGVEEFFRVTDAGVKPFAEAVLSLRGKWEYAKSKLPTAEDDQHLRFLSGKFEEYIFKFDDLKVLIERAIGGYVSRVQGIEGGLLVDVRADLSEGELAAAGLPKFLASDAAFRAAFQQALETAAAGVAADFKTGVSREVVSFVAGEIAAQIAVRTAAAVAARLGVSAGVLGTGAASSWGTFGLGLVAAVVVDVAISKVAKWAGYDPVARVSEKVQATLAQVRSLLVDGNPEARAAFEQLRKMETDDADANVRDESRKAADSIERSGNLGLRSQMLQLHEERARLRRAALQRLVLEPTEI
ncbi:MAG: hypothetical protein JNK76_10165 [Planctomycetales bacterium]|nr:hypothetical protein [Planctomycetales bacterium]MBN8625398.1 hypothetical protein [Planctomycetota bacterium]